MRPVRRAGRVWDREAYKKTWTKPLVTLRPYRHWLRVHLLAESYVGGQGSRASQEAREPAKEPLEGLSLVGAALAARGSFFMRNSGTDTAD